MIDVGYNYANLDDGWYVVQCYCIALMPLRSICSITVSLWGVIELIAAVS